MVTTTPHTSGGPIVSHDRSVSIAVHSSRYLTVEADITAALADRRYTAEAIFAVPHALPPGYPRASSVRGRPRASVE